MNILVDSPNVQHKSQPFLVFYIICGFCNSNVHIPVWHLKHVHILVQEHTHIIGNINQFDICFVQNSHNITKTLYALHLENTLIKSSLKLLYIF